MKVAFSIGYSGAQMKLPIERIMRAEALGYDAFFTAESYGSDAITPLAYMAALTKRIRLGTGIAQLAARTPANLAMSAQTIDAMAGRGRVIMGLGVSGPQIVEGWYGQPWGNPTARIRDYVAIMKKIWQRQGPVEHDGAEISVPFKGEGSSGLGKPLKSILHGNPDIPVLLGTATPGNIRMTAEIADGWIGMHLTPTSLKHYRSILEEGIAKRTDGKTLKDLELTVPISIVVTSDLKAAFSAAKPEVALYVGGMGAKGKNFHKDSMISRGFPEAAERIQELFLAGRAEEAAKTVPDEYIDEGGLMGPPDRIKERFAAWRDSGLTMLILNQPNDEAIEVMGQVIGK